MNLVLNKIVGVFSLYRPVVIILVVLIFVMLGLSVFFAVDVLTYENIYNGVYLNEKHIGNLSKEALTSYLNENFTKKIPDKFIYLKCKDITQTIAYQDINAQYDIDATVEQAHSIGREGNIFYRLYSIYETAKNGFVIDLPYSFEEKKVKLAIQEIYNQTFVSVKEPDLLLLDDEEKVIIYSGRNGEHINRNNAYEIVKTLIKEGKHGSLIINIIKTPPNKIDVNDYYNRIVREARNAETKVVDNNVIVVPHVTGRSIDKSKLLQIAMALENKENVERKLPVVFSQPKIKSNDIYPKLFKDTLATYQTSFNTSNQNNANRKENMLIACSKINGIIIAPDGTFSFNDVVGPRTENEGYKIAKVYVGGRIIDGVGGGICQVSTTLYNAVLLSDLKTVDRTNHMFTVGYVPLGRDAAVAYDTVDIKFQNDSGWPIRIECWITDTNEIHFSIIGTNENPEKTVEIIPRVISTIPYTTKYIESSYMEEGASYVRQSGHSGFLVDTYKVVKVADKVISEEKIHRSYYRPLSKEVVIGTKIPNPVVQPTIEAEQLPPVQEQPLDVLEPTDI